MRTLFAGALLASFIASPALAQEKAPFTGPHVEALAGYDHIGSEDASSDGLIYGGALGYDVQLGGAVVGIEGEAAGSTAKARDSGILRIGDSSRISAGRDLYVGGRVGFAVTPSTLLYAKGGYSNLRVNAVYDNGLGTVTSDHATLDGYRLGAGIEQRFSLLGPSGFFKAEYRYSNYGNARAGGNNFDIDLDRHQVLAGVGVRF